MCISLGAIPHHPHSTDEKTEVLIGSMTRPTCMGLESDGFGVAVERGSWPRKFEYPHHMHHIFPAVNLSLHVQFLIHDPRSQLKHHLRLSALYNSKRYMYHNVHSSTVCNRQDMEAT